MLILPHLRMVFLLYFDSPTVVGDHLEDDGVVHAVGEAVGNAAAQVDAL